MSRGNILLSSLLAFSMVCQGLDMTFYAGNCNGAYTQCPISGENSCCSARRPFCTSANCDGCVNGQNLRTYNHVGCGAKGKFFHQCVFPDHGCCNPAGDGNLCSAIVINGKAAFDTAIVNDKADDCVEPIKMVFYDENKLENQIYMPKGKFAKAASLFEAGKWDELKKFPLWGK